MSKVELNTVTNAQNISTINDNFTKIETALNDKVLYRDNPVGEPNALVTDVDANSKRIYNLPKPTTATEPLRLGDALEQLNITLDLVPKNVDSANPFLIDWFHKFGGLAPSMKFGNSSAGVTVTSSGQGTRIGDFAHAEAYTTLNTFTGVNGGLRIGGLPFTAKFSTPMTLDIDNINAASVSDKFVARVVPNTKEVILLKYDTADQSYLPVTEYDLKVGTNIRLSGTYTVLSTGDVTPPLVATPPYYWKTSGSLVTPLGTGTLVYAVNYFNAPDYQGWLATSRDGTKFLKSSDLVTWTPYAPANSIGAGYIYNIKYAGGYWIAHVGSALKIASSLDGPWSNVTFSGGPGGENVSQYTFINNRWYLLGTNGAIYKAPVNPTGAWVWKWTSGPGSSAYMRAIAAVGTTLVAMGTGSWSAKSTDDGETFSNNTLSGLPFTDISTETLASNGSEFIMASGQYVAASTNGTSWTTRQNMTLVANPYYNWMTAPVSLRYANGYWVMTHSGGNGASGFMYSTDAFQTIKRRNYSVSTSNRIAQYPIEYGNNYWVVPLGGDGLGTPEILYAKELM